MYAKFIRRRMCGALSFIAATLCVASAAAAPGGLKPLGKPYSTWAAEWWQWALETPASINPVLDETGEFCAVGQTGSVWFLAGTFGSASVRRSCTVPAGTWLLVPVANSFYGAFLTDPEEQRTEGYVREFVSCVEGAQVNLTVDGRAVRRVRFEQSDLFSVDLPEDNVYGVDESVVPELTLSPSVDAGYYAMLPPLSVGEHTIAWSVTPGESCAAPLDVVYSITVAPR